MAKKKIIEEKENELSRLASQKDEFDEQSRQIIDGLVFKDKELAQITEMKSTTGWKVLDKKIREELQNRIFELVEDDLKVQTLLALLSVSSIHNTRQMLEAEIARILPPN